MTYVWDTNIIIHALRNPIFLSTLDLKYDFFNPKNRVCISVVSFGELTSFARKNRWGNNRLNEMNQLLDRLEIIPVTNDEGFIDIYADIDIYSQSSHPILRLPSTARKMGKNDLWIATTTACLKGVLLSTDNDFAHLDGIFFYIDRIYP